MPRKRNNGLSEEKRNIIGQLVEMYDIKTAADIQEALKDLLGGTIQSMLETEPVSYTHLVQQQIGFGRMIAGHIDVLPIFLGLLD